MNFLWSPLESPLTLTRLTLARGTQQISCKLRCFRTAERLWQSTVTSSGLCENKKRPPSKGQRATFLCKVLALFRRMFRENSYFFVIWMKNIAIFGVSKGTLQCLYYVSWEKTCYLVWIEWRITQPYVPWSKQGLLSVKRNGHQSKKRDFSTNNHYKAIGQWPRYHILTIREKHGAITQIRKTHRNMGKS